MPTSPALRDVVVSGVNSDSLEIKIKEVALVWPLLLLTVAICVVLGLLVIHFMDENSNCFIWTLIVVGIIALLAVSVVTLLPSSILSSQHQHFLSSRILEIIIGVLCLLLALATVLLVRSQDDEIENAVSVVNRAAQFINSQDELQMVSLVLFLVSVLFAAVMFVFTAAIFSLGQLPAEKGYSLPYQAMVLRPVFKLMSFLFIFYALWGLAFIMDTYSFLASGTTVNWYYKLDGPYIRSRLRYFMYHMGSVVKGALLSILFGPIKLVAELLSVPFAITQPDPR